ncbi:hypothetical protein F4819DRAFT_53252 [Hypoxylon fuscum]|nr:hypothetical protein F4819DRAFT_53252 [Hypoxylon fuscum]
MLLFVVTASLVWHGVLAFFLARDFRLLLRVTRWATCIYLVVFGLFVAEALREGLVVNGAHTLHWDVRLAWAIWFVLVAASVADWRFLVPAVLLPLYVLSFPETRTLLNYGLARLGWLELVHSPVSFAMRRGVGLERVVKTKQCVDGTIENAVGPVMKIVKSALDPITSWAWAGDIEKLKSAEPWNRFLLGGWWKSWSRGGRFGR